MNTLYIVLDMPPLFGALKLLGKTYSLKQNSLLFLFCWRVCMFVFFSVCVVFVCSVVILEFDGMRFVYVMVKAVSVRSQFVFNSYL